MKYGSIPEEPAPRKPPRGDFRTVRTRLWMLVTYLTDSQIQSCIDYHIEQVKHYCYIYHDKDLKEDGSPKEPHFHILVECFNAKKNREICGWFKGFKDESGKDISVLAEPIKDRRKAFEYLYHKNDKDKAEYELTDIINVADGIAISGEAPRNDEDNSLNVFQDMLNGVSYYELVRRYGRDFIMNHNKYCDMVSLCITDNSLPDDLSEKQKYEIIYKYKDWRY